MALSALDATVSKPVRRRETKCGDCDTAVHTTDSDMAIELTGMLKSRQVSDVDPVRALQLRTDHPESVRLVKD